MSIPSFDRDCRLICWSLLMDYLAVDAFFRVSFGGLLLSPQSLSGIYHRGAVHRKSITALRQCNLLLVETLFVSPDTYLYNDSGVLCCFTH
jgi:hypothetical protein